MTVYAVVNRKGGVGKTTTSVTLAHGLAKKLEASGKHVLLIDLDPQGNCATSLGINTNGADIANLLTGQATLKECIVSADKASEGGPSRPNLYLLPASDALTGARANLIAQEAASIVASRFGSKGNNVTPIENILEDKLGNARQVFAYIILDCPPSLDILNSAVYHFADEAIVPVKVDFLGATGTAQHTDDIIKAQASGIKIKIGAVVPTFVWPRRKLARQMLASLRKAYGDRVSEPIPHSVKVEESPASGGGMTVFEYAPDSEPAKAYQVLVDRMYHD